MEDFDVVRKNCETLFKCWIEGEVIIFDEARPIIKNKYVLYINKKAAELLTGKRPKC